MIPGFTDVWWGPENEIHCFGPEFGTSCSGAAKAWLTSPDFVEFWSAEISQVWHCCATFACGKSGGDKKTGRVMSCVLFG